MLWRASFEIEVTSLIALLFRSRLNLGSAGAYKLDILPSNSTDPNGFEIF